MTPDDDEPTRGEPEAPRRDQRRLASERHAAGFTRSERERILVMLEDHERARTQQARIVTMLEDHERARWFWSTVGIAAKWVTSVSAATVILITALKWGFGEVTRWRP